MRTSVGFWAAAVLLAVRAWSRTPAPAAHGPQTLAAAAVFALYVVGTVAAVQRARSAAAPAAADLIWTQGAAGLVLAAVLLSLL